MLETVREICRFEGRLTGTDAERRAANHVADRLRSSGRGAEVEPIHVHPQYALVMALHCLLGFAGSLASVASPPVGFALVLLAATSMYLDLNGRLYLLRRLFFRRASQNVVSRGSHPDAPARLLIAAHLDSAKTGSYFDPGARRRNERIAGLLPFPWGPFRLLFWSLAALLPLLGLRLAGIDSNGISVLQLIPTLALLIGVFSLVDIELSDVVPGANDNASGVAVALELGAELQARSPEHLDVWVVITGGEECLSEGMRAFVRSHRDELERSSTFVVNLDSVGRGDLRYSVSQGFAVSFEMDRRLIELCAALGEGHDAEPIRRGSADDAFAARIARLRPISLGALEPGALTPPDYHLAGDLPDRVDPDALERAYHFAAELIAAVDRDVARSSG
jgi:hypothetical protein